MTMKGSFITSQNDTAPKHIRKCYPSIKSFITSQNDTAPKPWSIRLVGMACFITSQNDTAPKPLRQNPYCEGTFVLTGDNS